MGLEKAFECINQCPNFTTIGNPSYCPHCGAKEVYAVDDTVTTFRTVDEYYENR